MSGLRGQLRQPGSRRDIAEQKHSPTETIQDNVQPPEWLAARLVDRFRALIEQQRVAGVGLRQVDADAYARYCVLQDDFERIKKPKEKLSVARELTKMCAVLSIGEKERKRLGVRNEKKKETPAVAALIRMPSRTPPPPPELKPEIEETPEPSVF